MTLTREDIFNALASGPKDIHQIARELGHLTERTVRDTTPEFRELFSTMIARHEIDFTRDWKAVRSRFDNRRNSGNLS